MKKKSYQLRAWEYIRELSKYVRNWIDFDDIIDATDKVFWHTGIYASAECGSARIAVVGKDFVIKWDYDECVKEIGGCEDEFRIYKQTLSTGFSHLLAAIYRVSYNEKWFYIMPRIHDIGMENHHYKDLKDYTTKEEYFWLINHIGDLHSYNWGIENGKAVVVDYACPC